MTVATTQAYVQKHWPKIEAQLRSGTYRPLPVKRVEIPKPGGGVRKLGIPSALDRLIQQAILQVLQPHFDPTFSEHSYGFRPWAQCAPGGGEGSGISASWLPTCGRYGSREIL